MDWRQSSVSSDFNPLPPRGGRRGKSSVSYTPDYFNPLPPRGGRPNGLRLGAVAEDISTHSLLAEGDLETVHKLTDTIKFQPTPSSRRETIKTQWRGKVKTFQPTPSSRRETRQKPRRGEAAGFQPTPSSRRETGCSRQSERKKKFQPTPSSRRETLQVTPGTGMTVFQPTPSSRRETPWPQRSRRGSPDFNPLPPRGGRPHAARHTSRRGEFQPTPSSRRET